MHIRSCTEFFFIFCTYIISTTSFTSSHVQRSQSLKVTITISRHHNISEASNTQTGEYPVRVPWESEVTRHTSWPSKHTYIEQIVSKYVLTSRSSVTGALVHGRGRKDRLTEQNRTNNGSSPFGPAASRPYRDTLCTLSRNASHGSPVPSIKFQIAARLRLLKSSRPRKKEPR
jgi:hypothetical protein